jgi:L-ribulose-5-phosphate 3-epimerase
MVSAMKNIGFMQGRLSPLVHCKIQAFPANTWMEEFSLARAAGFSLMEWTLDHDGLGVNPLMTPDGREIIGKLSRKFGVRVESVTGDCFMQAPFFKATGARRDELITELYAVIDSCGSLDARYLVIPIVDDGRLESDLHADILLTEILNSIDKLAETGLKIVFESDLPPDGLAAFIDKFPAEYFGVNYDTGNSAGEGFNPSEEIAAYGHRILNVHIKDRALNGATVPLGTGAADFPTIFGALTEADYSGNFILQTARATNGDHLGTLSLYRDMVYSWSQGAL